MKNLSDHDRYAAQLAMGGYAQPEFVADFVKFVDAYDMFNHPAFSDYSFIQGLPIDLIVLFSNAVTSVSEGSLLYVPEYTLYKHHGSMLSALNNYVPGYVGYQQLPWVASAEEVSVFSQASSLSDYNQSEVNSSFNRNTHLPFVRQNENIALVIYNPNRDLGLLGMDDLGVWLHFDDDFFDEVIDFEAKPASEITQSNQKWLLGRSRESYLGVYRHCLVPPDGDIPRFCPQTKQIWAAVVGNNLTHGSFEEFEQMILN